MAPISSHGRSPSKGDGDDVHYTVFVRLPFSRGEFIDPPPVEWGSVQDEELWTLLSLASSKGRDIDWNELAGRFGVTLAFLSQQAAWLYERQLSQVRAQLRNVNKSSSTTGSPAPGSVIGSRQGTQAKHRTGSGGEENSKSRDLRKLMLLQDRGFSLHYQIALKTEPHLTERKVQTRLACHEPMSRTTSTNTVTQVQHTPPAATRSPVDVSPSFAQRRLSRETGGRSVEASPKSKRPSFEKRPSLSTAVSDSSTSSESESEALHPMVRSRAFARRPRFSSSKAPPNPLSDADEEEEESPPFLPFSGEPSATPVPLENVAATVKASPKKPVSEKTSVLPSAHIKSGALSSKQGPQSSSSSAQSQPASGNRKSQRTPAALSPRQRRAVKEGSDDSPSMGSSFSDLEDTSLSQSALEEALANEMAHGGVASKMSTISQALKSRYL